MADPAATATNEGFNALTAFLAKDNRRDTQERRSSQKMMQAGDSQITMWVRRVAVSVENIERMFKSFLVDAEVRQNKMIEALMEAARGGSGGGGKGGKGDQAADDPKFDWKKGSKGWLAGLTLPILVGLATSLKNYLSDPEWVKEAGLEGLSGKLGKILGGSKDGGWLNAILQGSAMMVPGLMIGATAGFAALGPVGALAGALLGAIVGGIGGAIAGWFGAESIAKLVDPHIKGIKRLLGMEVEASQKIVDEATQTWLVEKKKRDVATTELKKLQAQLKTLEADPATKADTLDAARQLINDKEDEITEQRKIASTAYMDRLNKEYDLIYKKINYFKAEETAAQGEATNLEMQLKAAAGRKRIIERAGNDTAALTKVNEEIAELDKKVLAAREKQLEAKNKKDRTVQEMKIFQQEGPTRRQEANVSLYEGWNTWWVPYGEIFDSLGDVATQTAERIHAKAQTILKLLEVQAATTEKDTKKLKEHTQRMHGFMEKALKGVDAKDLEEVKKAWFNQLIKTRGRQTDFQYGKETLKLDTGSPVGGTAAARTAAQNIRKLTTRLLKPELDLQTLYKAFNAKRAKAALKPWTMEQFKESLESDFDFKSVRGEKTTLPVAPTKADTDAKLKADAAAAASNTGKGPTIVVNAPTEVNDNSQNMNSKTAITPNAAIPAAGPGQSRDVPVYTDAWWNR